jgi:hypothetical protein
MARKSHKRTHRRSKRGFLKKLTRTANKTLPAIASGITNVGSNVKNITLKNAPKIEKGLGAVYGSVLTGFDLGVKGISKGISTIQSQASSKTRRHRRRH